MQVRDGGDGHLGHEAGDGVDQRVGVQARGKVPTAADALDDLWVCVVRVEK